MAAKIAEQKYPENLKDYIPTSLLLIDAIGRSIYIPRDKFPIEIHQSIRFTYGQYRMLCESLRVAIKEGLPVADLLRYGRQFSDFLMNKNGYTLLQCDTSLATTPKILFQSLYMETGSYEYDVFIAKLDERVRIIQAAEKVAAAVEKEVRAHLEIAASIDSAAIPVHSG